MSNPFSNNNAARSLLHSSHSSTSSSVQPNPGGSGWRQISHRPSSSFDRQQQLQQHQQQQQQQQQQHSQTYSNAPIPASPTVGIGISNTNFPANYSVAGYGRGDGQRGVKHTGLGLSKHMDDNASVASLIMDRDGSYDGHHSESDHAFSNHGHLPPIPGGRLLREKTSFTHLKNSDHKILSNEEKYNAYVIPGVAHFDGPENDDALHDPGPRLLGKGPDRRLADSKSIHGSAHFFTLRGWLNVLGLACILLPMVGFFAIYPVIAYAIKLTELSSPSALHTNGTGQVPDIANFRGLVDRDTPNEVYTKTGQDGNQYTLVFSDEFELDGRTFNEGDDPYWTAVDMHYYSTSDVEYYDPQSVTTSNGYLVINLTHVKDPSQNHNLSYLSGMLQSWNQFCFTGGIVEASVSLPGTTDVTGFWPAFWTMGNLGRAGYGSTLDGTWPYSYDSCDSGTLPNQTDFTKSKNAIQTTYGNTLSYLPGQKLSACTCSGEDHPGPSSSVGRSAPELDVFEALVNPLTLTGEISQTLQIAPFDMDYVWDNSSTNYDATKKFKTEINPYRGSDYQQSCSALSLSDQESYYLEDPTSFQTYSYEYSPSKGANSDGYVHWLQNGSVTWTLKESGLAGNSTLDISQRLLPREPMYMIMNLGMAENFSPIDFDDLRFPALMRFDWIRVYQRTDSINIGCDPSDFPTADYINRHVNAYTDYNLTVWSDVESNGFPKNSLLNGC